MGLQSYDEVVTYLKKKKRTPHLLLGNGFSVAYNSKIFSYNALHGFVEEIEDELLSKIFGIVKTKNFELVMQQLGNFCELIEAFGSDKALLIKVQKASASLKNTLLEAVKKLHPEHVFEVPDEESKQCSKFLSHFIESNGNIFSTNYDLLLYWTLMRNGIANSIDGFGREREDDEDDPETEPEYSELIWGKHKDIQNIHHLHGTLPIFDTGIDIIKEEYSGAHYLLENIEERMDGGEYPVFVASGNGDEKLNHIMHNRYLTYCYEALSNIQGSLVTFGFNFGLYDDHIIDAINKSSKFRAGASGKLWSIYIGVYSEEDEKHIKSISGKFKCKVNMYDAKTAKVWR